MELTQLLQILRRQVRAGAVAFLLVMLLGGAAAFLPPDRFTADATLLAQPDPEVIQFGQIQLVEFLIPSLESIATSDGLEREVRADLPAGLGDEAFTTRFANEPGTGVVRISVESENRAATAAVANLYAERLVAAQPVPDLLTLSVIDPASVPSSPSAPARMTIVIGTIVLALLAMVLTALLFNTLRRRKVSSELLRSRFGTSLLGELPPLKRRQLGDGTAATLLGNEKFPAAVEAYQRLRSNVELLLLDQPRAIAITSLYSGEGKSTVAAVLGWSLASAGNQVTIIDADLRRPAAHKRLGEAFGPGLGEMREGAPVPAARPTRLPTLEFYPAGTPSRHPSEIITTALPALMDNVERSRGRLLIVDAPPLIGVAESHLIAALSTAVIIVVDARRFNEQALEQALYELHRAGTAVLGVVLNRAKLSRRDRRMYEYYATGGYANDAADDIAVT